MSSPLACILSEICVPDFWQNWLTVLEHRNSTVACGTSEAGKKLLADMNESYSNLPGAEGKNQTEFPGM